MPQPTLIAEMLIGLGLAVAFFGFIVLGDLTQKVVAFPRAVVGAVWRARFALMAVSIAAMAGGLYLGLDRGLLSAGGAGWLLAAFGLFFGGGFIIVPYLMFRPDGTRAHFAGHERAGKYLNGGAEIAVVETDGEVRGYPLDWITRPHVAANRDNPFGASNVVMTYCSLSHSAIAYEPRIGDRTVELSAAGQLSNNLILYDHRSGRLIQQFYGSFGLDQDGAASMPRPATRIMPYRAYQALYPDGRVYFNPPGAPFRGALSKTWDRAVRALMKWILDAHYDRTNDKPWFPTITHFDPRLPPKDFVYAFDIAGDRVAYSKEFLIANGDRVDVTIGGEAVAIVHFPEHGFVDAFKTGGRDLGVIDAMGRTGDGEQLVRQPMFAEVFWMVWAHYYPGTGLNRE